MKNDWLLSAGLFIIAKFSLSKTRKAPGALYPGVVLPPPGRVKYVTVTQDKSPCLCSKRHGEYFFGRAKTGGLGQVTTKKQTTEKKWVLLDPVLTAG